MENDPGFPETTSQFAPMLLAAHQCQGLTNNCGPFAAATILNTLMHTNTTGDEIAERMNHPRLIGILPVIRRVPNWASFPWGLVDILKENGIHADWRPFRKPLELLDNLHSGLIQMVILGSWSPLWAHVLVLVAYHPEHGWGFSDPAMPDKKIYWRDHQSFLHQWTVMGRNLIRVYPLSK